MRFHALPALALLALAACNSGPSTEDSARRTGDIRLENTTVDEVARQTVAAEDKTRMDPGEWETSYKLVKLDVPGMPAGPMRDQMMGEAGKPPKVMKVCRKASESQAIDVTKLSPTQRSCKFPKYVLAGGKMDAEMVCDGPFGAVRMAINGTQTKTSYDLTMVQSQKIPGQAKDSTMTIRMTGKRLGECRA